jgi:Flp pilus assembly protein TadD
MLRDAGTPELPKGVELRIYDVSDLTLTPQDNAGPDLQVQTVDPTDAAAGGASDNPFITATDQAQDTPANIADMIRAHVRPESWSKDTSIEEREGRLVVKQSAEVHAMIDQLLSNFRATQKIMVNVHGGFILLREADQAGADQMGVNDVPPSSGDAPASSSTKSLSGRDQAPPAAGAVTESALQAQDHLEAAKRLYKAFEYKAAQAELLRAVNLNQKDEKARELLVEVNDVLNKRQDRIQSAVQSLARSQQVAIQERMVTLDNRLDWGNRYVASAQEDPELTLAERIRRYQQAQDAFERARELVKWMPVGVDVSEQQHEAERMIKEVIHARRDLEVQLAEEDKQSAMELSISRATQEREREQRRVAVQLDEAKALFEVGEYERAEAVAGKILETDPTNAEAHALQVTADDRKHIKKAKWLEEEYNEQFQRQKELADNNLIPHEDYLVYPDNWAEIAQRTGHRVPVPSSGESDGERAKEKEPLTAGLNYYIKGHNARAGHEPDHAEDTGVPVPGFTKTPTNGPTSTFSTVGTITTGDARQSAPGNNAYIDSTVENKYGPTPQVRPRLDPNFPIDKAMVSRNADGTVTVVLDYEVSGDAFDPVIRKMPAAEYEALKREVEELRTKANAGTQASTEAGRAQKDDLASEELLKTIIERGKHGPKTAISETALCPICQKPLYLHTADGFSCTPPAGTVRMPIGIENAPARVDELTNVNALLESDMRRQLDAARSELARARSDKQKIELDLADQNRRISEAIQKGMPPEIFQKQGGEPQQRPLPSTDVSMKASTIDTEPRGTVGESELKRQLDAVRGELATVEREKKQIEQDLAEQTQRITSSLQRGVPMELFYSQDPEAFQKPLPDSRVLAIRPELDLVMLSVGAKDGAKPGYRMTIGRGEQYLAKAEIQKVYPDMCSARLFLKRGEVQVNDTAFSRVPGSGDSAKEGKKAARSPDAEEANRILQDYITYPEGWADTHPRAGDAGRARTGEPWMMDIQRRLSRRVSFEFRDTPLQEALTFLQTLSKVNITLDPKAATAPTTQLKITLRVTDMDMETALKWILRLAELDYELRPEGVFISTRELLRREQNDPPAPPAGTDGTKADEKKELADQMAAARKHLQEALAALPRTDVTARQRLRLFAELASLSTGADVYRVLNDGIANFGGEGPFAEALAKIFLQTARNEKDPAALEAALAFTTDSALRANMAARCGDLTAESEHRLALFARAYQESPDFLRAYAWNLTHAGKIKEATGLLEEALRKGLNEPWIVKQLEENYRAVEDQAGQLRVLTQAVAQRPREAEPRLQLARTLEALGRKTEALRELRLAREFRPEDLQNHRAYLALAERLEDRAAIEDALWGLLDRDWPNDRSVQSDAEKRWKKLTNEYRDAGQEVKVKELSEKLLRLKALDLVVRLSWDTDETDVDLHVKEPSGHETSYESKQSARGANLDRDIMNGYGPETYTLRRAAKGTYGISVNYYHGSRKTKATVTVTRHKGAPEEQTRTFEVRLERTGDTANVTEVVIE